MISPLYGQLSPLRIPTKVAGREVQDSDALAYIAAVETADAQTLEDGVKFAFEDFIVGCKADGIWSALKASCILAGARTLSGALVPLVGTAPTNFNFVTADYNRETGLVGDGTTKYLSSNRSGDSDPQNDSHISAWQSLAASSGVRVLMGYHRQSAPATFSSFVISATQYYTRLNNSTTAASNLGGGNTIGLFGATRSSSSSYIAKSGTGSLVTISRPSSAPAPLNHYVFALNSNGSLGNFHPGRISFYSIGESLDLALLDTRVSTLMTDLAAAIP